MRHLLAALLVVPLLAPLLAGCGGDEYADYCEVVEEHQTELTDITSAGGPTALLDALDIYRDLAEQAPNDVADDWKQVVTSIEGLQSALDDAGVDPATYDPENLPDGVTEEQADAIVAAADEVGSLRTQEAFGHVEQQARDVCHTPLTL